jgi:hypothetical protein
LNVREAQFVLVKILVKYWSNTHRQAQLVRRRMSPPPVIVATGRCPTAPPPKAQSKAGQTLMNGQKQVKR